MTHFDPEVSIELIEKEKATIIYPAFPAITQVLIDHPRFPTADLSRVRMMNNVGPPETLRKYQAALPDAIQISAYGCTEVSGVVCQGRTTDSLKERTESSGAPFKGVEVRIVDDVSGRKELGVGEKGEIVVRGYCLFEGYYKDEKKTAETMDSNGWFHTGDLGTVDPEGRITYLGRKKDMLKVGGENVAPAEVEAFLCTHPAVKSAQVIGASDDHLVEVPAAFIELVEGANITENDLIEYCFGKIAKFKIPKYIEFIKEWPMTATSKIQKFELKKIFELRKGKRSV